MLQKLPANPFQLVAGAVLYFAIGEAVGFAAWGNWEESWRLALIVVLAPLWAMAPTRASAYALMLGYYLMGSRGLPAGAEDFFGSAAPVWLGWLLWIVASLLLAAPYGLLWSREQMRAGWRLLGAVAVSLIPPLGLIGWLSLFTPAGTMYPGLGWVGLLLFGALLYAFAERQWYAAIGLLVLSVTANFYCADESLEPPSMWGAADTRFPALNSGGQDDAAQLLAARARVEWLKRTVIDMPSNSVVVLPETLLGRFDVLAEDALRGTEWLLAARDSRVLVGAEIPLPDGRYRNALVVLGAGKGEDRAASQSVPVPLAMWRPWSKESAVLDLAGGGNTISVRDQRVGVAVCYEQLLAFSMLRLMLDRPTVIAAPSNVWWAGKTSIPMIQTQSLQAFARLFGVPVLIAKNF